MSRTAFHDTDGETSEAPSVGRRSVLAVAGAALAGSAGCVRQTRALLTRDDSSRVSLSIKTVPADADPRATRIARFLAEKLQAVGVDASVALMSRESLYRDVLVNQQFDLYVARHPARADPDFLRTLLHSRFAVEPGWQNPFGFADLDVDRLLERQRRLTGRARRRTLAKLQREVTETQPFTVVAFPDEIRAVRADRIVGWSHADVHTPLGYLALSERDPPDSVGDLGPGNTSRNASVPREGGRREPEPPDDPGVGMALTDVRALENLNPLSVAFRDEGVITGLLYDPLGRRVEGRVRPWLAASWDWVADARDAPTLEVRLREDLRWHDGEALTAADVAFTYRFLGDTSLGRRDSPVPAPRFRGRESVVDGTEVVDDRTVRLHARPGTRDVVRWALTVPVLPEHVWRETAQQATVAGVDADVAVTEALVWSNQQPVGSGPLRVEDLRVQKSLSLERFEDHFLTREASDPYLRPYRGGFEPGRLTFHRAPSTAAAVSMVRSGDVDGTASGVLPENVPAIGRDDRLQLYVNRSRSFYHLGFNVRRAPFANTRFRRAVARLLDEDHLVRRAFDGYGSPAASPLARHVALAPGLAWDGRDPGLAFPGEDGALDIERARRAFRRAGYRYDDDGALLTS